MEGGLPFLGHALEFAKGPVYMVERLRGQYRSMFTTTVATQRITFMQARATSRPLMLKNTITKKILKLISRPPHTY